MDRAHHCLTQGTSVVTEGMHRAPTRPNSLYPSSFVKRHHRARNEKTTGSIYAHPYMSNFVSVRIINCMNVRRMAKIKGRKQLRP